MWQNKPFVANMKKAMSSNLDTTDQNMITGRDGPNYLPPCPAISLKCCKLSGDPKKGHMCVCDEIK